MFHRDARDRSEGIDIANGDASVSVRLPGAPAGDAADAKSAITDVVTRACSLKIERVDVSY